MLVIRYDAAQNEYSLFRHNLTPDEAKDAVLELAAKLFGLFVIDQKARHRATQPISCPACQEDVEHSSHVQPKPQLKRRSE